MQKLDLERAGDFVAMAATLIQIKSKMLLPNHDGDLDEDDDLDPRHSLVSRLLEYQKYQDASFALNERELLGRNIFARGSKTQIKPDEDLEEEIIIDENPLFGLISSYRAVLKAVKKTVHRVAGELKSISQRILELRDRLIVGTKTSYFMLIRDEAVATGLSNENDSKSNGNVLITFLSLLELARMGFVSLFQSQNYEDIHVESLKEIDRNVVSRADGFEEAGNILETTLSASLEITEEDREAVQNDIDTQQEVSVEAFAEVSESEFPDEIEYSLDNKSWSEEAATDEEIAMAEKELV